MPTTPFDKSVVTIDEQTLSFIPLTVEADQFKGPIGGSGSFGLIEILDLSFGMEEISLDLNLAVLDFGRDSDRLEVIWRSKRMTNWVIRLHRCSIYRDHQFLP